ncbi:MAG: ATP-dependent helicase [Candidatus Accumulibacter sp.]|jgi:hypothetical protein|uniref:ATP-binding domain-containing protein n=1 Tax=Accumulibacter sp. TaxID=2053492 RepID=UPI002586729C|nr:ATP-binding domain-containing protein [Accumulibacter sp.]MBK8117258.1 ATP-dependent helicase [Accumulibacter sp.]
MFQFEAVNGTTPIADARLILEAIRKFCFDDSEEIKIEHFPSLVCGSLGELANRLLPYAKDLWCRLIDKSSHLPITHDVYLKAWTLAKPRLPYDCIMFDESQDANRAMAQLVLSQSASQQIFVGDRFQRIYGWRGSCDASRLLGSDFFRKSLTRTFRFGQNIADIANQIITVLGATEPLIGNDSSWSMAKKACGLQAIITRTNSGAIEEALKLHGNHRVAMLVDEEFHYFVIEAERFVQHEKVEHPAFVGFANWNQFKSATENGDYPEYLPWVKAFMNFGGDKLICLLDSLKKERAAEYIVSTAHRAKGREWSTVRLTNDFRSRGNNDDQEEGNVLYVAVTRAIKSLDYHESAALQYYRSMSPYGTYVDRREFGFGKIRRANEASDPIADIGQLASLTGEFLQNQTNEIKVCQEGMALIAYSLLDALNDFVMKVSSIDWGQAVKSSGALATAAGNYVRLSELLSSRLKQQPTFTTGYSESDVRGQLAITGEYRAKLFSGWLAFSDDEKPGDVLCQLVELELGQMPAKPSRNRVFSVSEKYTQKQFGVMVVLLLSWYSTTSLVGFGIWFRHGWPSEQMAALLHLNLFNEIESFFEGTTRSSADQEVRGIPLLLSSKWVNSPPGTDQNERFRERLLDINRMFTCTDLLLGRLIPFFYVGP